MKLPWFFVISLSLTAVYAWICNQIPSMDQVANSTWWYGGLGLVASATWLSRFWVSRASRRGPMGFVAAVNGSTAIKMFTLLALISTYLFTHDQGRAPFALGVFGLFVLQLILFVWDIARLLNSEKKKS